MRQILPLRHHRLTRGWSLDDVARRLIALGQETDEDNLGVTGHMARLHGGVVPPRERLIPHEQKDHLRHRTS